MRSAQRALVLARRVRSASSSLFDGPAFDGTGVPPASRLVAHKLNLTAAERLAGASSRSDAEARAADYLRRRRGGAAAPEAAEEAFTTPAGAAAPLDDTLDARRAMYHEPPPESGLAAVAERAIRAAQRAGSFDKLQRSGAPLSELLDPHEATHFSSDPMARILKSANYRPASLELKAEVEAARAAALAELAAAAGAALQRGGGAAAAAAALCGDAARGRTWAALNSAVRAYNSAALADRESYGALWPAHPRRLFDLAADAADAVAAAAAEKGR